MSSFRLGPEVFLILSSLVEERTGIHYGAQDRGLFGDKVATRAIEAGFESALDYYYFLRYDSGSAAELDALVDALVVNETYFYREADALRTVVELLVRPVVAKGTRPRVWCAGCSTGEEPLTLAMMLADASLLSETEIVASDISSRALRRAEQGVYRPRSLRALPAGVRDRWFDIEGETVRVRGNLRDAITWRHINFVDAAAIATMGSFDVILCRNVLIYFADATIVSVVRSLAATLNRGGHVLVGVSESLMRFGTLLQCQELGGVFFYTRPPA